MSNNQAWTVEAMRALTVLWRTLPLQGVSDERGTMEDYCFALRNYSNDAIWNVVNALREGSVKDASTKWSPRAPELSRWVKDEQARLDAVAELEARKSVKKLSEDEQRSEERSAEHRVKVGGWFELLRRSQRGDKAATEELQRLFPHAMDPWKARYPHLFRGGSKS
ncbi:MAG: hypothetical protein ACK4SQ_14435 [Allorhizobium sp.]